MGAQSGDPRQWVQVFQQLFDRSDSHIALINLDGEILAVNAAWLAFGAANKMPAEYQAVGRNYLQMCETAAMRGRADASFAMQAYIGVQTVLQAGRPKFTMVYTCHAPFVRRWFRMWVEPQTPDIPVVVIAHKLIEEKEPVETSEERPASTFPDSQQKIGARTCQLPVAKIGGLAYQIGVPTHYEGSLARNHHHVMDRNQRIYVPWRLG